MNNTLDRELILLALNEKVEAPSADFAPELVAFATSIGEETTPEILTELKSFMTETREESKVSLKDTKEERRVVYEREIVPFNEKIAKLQALIRNCNTNLGVKPKAKRATKLELAVLREAELQAQLVSMQQALNALVTAQKVETPNPLKLAV